MLLVDRAACTEYAGLSHRSRGGTKAERETSLHGAPTRGRAAHPWGVTLTWGVRFFRTSQFVILPELLSPQLEPERGKRKGSEPCHAEHQVQEEHKELHGNYRSISQTHTVVISSRLKTIQKLIWMVQDLTSVSTHFTCFLKRFDHVNTVLSSYTVVR